MKVSKASIDDLSAAKRMMRECCPFRCGKLYADKAYFDSKWAATLKQEYSVELVTPWKKKIYDTLKSGNAFSTFVRGIRQPIESLFNWLDAKTNIENALKVRSGAGLLVHIFGRIAATVYSRFFNP